MKNIMFTVYLKHVQMKCQNLDGGPTRIQADIYGTSEDSMGLCCAW